MRGDLAGIRPGRVDDDARFQPLAIVELDAVDAVARALDAADRRR